MLLLYGCSFVTVNLQSRTKIEWKGQGVMPTRDAHLASTRRRSDVLEANQEPFECTKVSSYFQITPCSP